MRHKLNSINSQENLEIDLIRFRAAMDVSADGIYIIDREKMQFIDFNQIAYESLGYTREELVEKGPHEIKPYVSEAELAAIFDTVISGDEDNGFLKTVHQRKDGSTFPVEIYLRVLHEKEKTCLIASVRDISEREASELAIQKQQGLFESMFRDSPDALVMTNIDRKIMLVNNAFTNMFGYSATEVEGQSTTILYENPNEFLATGRELVNTTTQPENAANEVYYKRKNNTLFPSETVSNVLRDTEGNVLGFLAHIRDITKRKASESELKLAIETAEKANKAKNEFFSRMSHELRTPLNAILGFTQLMEMDSDDPLSESQRKNNDEISKAGKHLLSLINEVLDLARVESGRMELYFEPIDLNGQMQEAINLLTSNAKHNKVQLCLNSCSLDNHQLTSDKIRLKQILLNLLSNAIKYNKENGTVVLKSEIKNNNVRISVEDTGIGIPENLQHDLFQPFTRLLNKEHNIEGSGIGLAIAKNLTEHLNGKMGYQRKDNGSIFWFELPLEPLNSKAQ